MSYNEFIASFRDDMPALCSNDDVEGLKKLRPLNAQWAWTRILGLAASYDAINIADYCLSQGAKVGTGTIDAIAKGKAPRIYAMLETRDIIMDQDDEEGDVVFTAVHHNNADLVRFCLRHGAHPNGWQRWEYTSRLCQAIKESSLEIVKILHEAGATWENALHVAAARNRRDVADYLLDQGHDANVLGIKQAGYRVPGIDKDMATPLQRAMVCGHVELAEYLIDKTDLRVRDEGGRLPAEAARELGLIELANKIEATQAKRSASASNVSDV